jgi:hypothetical protein
MSVPENKEFSKVVESKQIIKETFTDRIAKADNDVKLNLVEFIMNKHKPIIHNKYDAEIFLDRILKSEIKDLIDKLLNAMLVKIPMQDRKEVRRYIEEGDIQPKNCLGFRWFN